MGCTCNAQEASQGITTDVYRFFNNCFNEINNLITPTLNVITKVVAFGDVCDWPGLPLPDQINRVN